MAIVNIPGLSTDGGANSVKFYGAKGDGTTDDTAAIQAALTANAGARDTWLPSATYKVASILQPASLSAIRGGPGAKLKATRTGTGFDGTITGTRTNTTNVGTLTSDAVLTGVSAVTSYGTAPPAVTLTGTAASAFKALIVICTLGGARGVWTGKMTIDGTDPATSGTAQSFTSAGTVAITGSGLTLNIAAGDASTDNKWTALGSRGLRLTMPSAPTAGQALEVAHSTSSAIYDLITVYGAASPFVVTIDRPVLWAFVATDTATEVSAYPKRVTVEGLRLRGTGTMGVEVAAGADWSLRDVHVETGDGDMDGYGLVFDQACLRMRLRDFTVDLPDATTTKVGVLVQSNEGTVVEGGYVKSVGSFAYWCCDNTSSTFADLWSDDTGKGLYVGAVAPGTTLGGGDCVVRGGGARNVKTTGLEVAYAARILVDGYTVENAGGTAFLLNHATGPRLRNVTARNADVGLSVDSSTTDARVSGLTLAGCRTNAITAAADLRVEHAEIDNTDSGYVVNASGGIFRLLHSRVTDAKANGVCVEVQGGVKATIRGCKITAGGSGTPICIYATGAGTVLTLEDCILTGAAGSIALYIRSGATIRLGKNVDMTGCATAIDNSGGYLSRGTVSANGASWVDIAWPDIRATDHVFFTRTSNSGQNFPPRVALVVGSKIQILCEAGDTSTYEYTVE